MRGAEQKTYRFREAREKAGLSTLEVAKRIGVSQPAVTYWDNGTKPPSIETLCKLADLYLFFVFNFHPSNSLQNVLVPVYSNSKEFVVEFTSDDEKYGGYNQIAHQVYPVKEFNGQRFVELYIPARTAIVLREIKD